VARIAYAAAALEGEGSSSSSCHHAPVAIVKVRAAAVFV
jgi:hypothetical protein